MLSISDGGSLSRALSLLNNSMKHLLLERRDQLGGEIAGIARFVVVQPGDLRTCLEKCFGFSVFQNAGDGTWYGDPDYTPGFEWIEDHGFCWELAFQFTDDFTQVVFVENAKGVDRRLLGFCTQYASEHAE